MENTGGRPATVYWPNEAQSCLIVMKSDADDAPNARQEIIEVYMAWRQGKMVPSVDHIGISSRREHISRDADATKPLPSPRFSDSPSPAA
jgi:hypothetical protein